MESHVLLVDTSSTPSSELRAQLAECGFPIQTASEINDALASIEQFETTFALIRTDDDSGIAWCRSLHLLTSVPLIVLCTAHNEDLIVQYLEAGADSVLAAPLSRRELAARISAVLCRRIVSPRPVEQSRAYHAGELRIDLDAHIVTKSGNELSLTPTEFRLLAALARREGETVTHGELLAEVWGENTIESPENLRLYIGYLREKLGDNQGQHRLLLNQRGVGYKLAGNAASADREREFSWSQPVMIP